MDGKTQSLLLNDDLFKGLIDGTKHNTIRRGRRDIALGDLTIENATGDMVEVVEVTSVTHKRLRNITSLEARESGHSDTDRLIATLKEFYPELSLDEEMTIVGFGNHVPKVVLTIDRREDFITVDVDSQRACELRREDDEWDSMINVKNVAFLLGATLEEVDL